MFKKLNVSQLNCIKSINLHAEVGARKLNDYGLTNLE